MLLKFPSWHELIEKIGEFEKSVDSAVGKNVQGFQEKHPLGDKAVRTIISLLPAPFSAIAENIYRTSEGSDEEKFEKIKEFFATIEKQGEEHYNHLSAKSDAIIQEVLNLQDITAKESTIQLIKNMMIGQSDTINQQLEQIKESLMKIKATQIGGDQIGYWVRGDNNIIGKNIHVLNQEIKPTGLTILEPDYFERHKNVKNDFENWKKGYAFELPSIYYGYEFRRESVIDEIKQKVQVNNRVLLVGESGTSKSTILMEIICDYYRSGYTVLHNLGSSHLTEPNEIVKHVEGLLKGNNKLLIAIDNAHDKKMAAIFYVIDQLSFIDSNNALLFVVTARLPEYDTLVSKRQLELEDRDRVALKKFNESTNIKYLVPYFSNAEEVAQLFTFYKTKYNIDKASPKSYLDIFNETGGQPIMVKFFLLGKGLREDVENRYKAYLYNSETNKPISTNIQTMLVCTLFSISNYIITDEVIDEMNVRKYAKSIIGILRTREDGTWTTIHPRWDMELFSYLFSSEDEDEIDDRIRCLANACISIFELGDKQFSLEVLSALYEIAGKKTIPVKIVNDVVRIPDYIANDKDAMYSIHTFYKAGAYYNLKMFDESLFENNKAIGINPDYANAYNNKGLALYGLGKSEEAVKCYDKAIKIDPDFPDAYFNKGLVLYYDLSKSEEAVKCYDKAIDLDPNFVAVYINKGISLNTLGEQGDSTKYEEAIKCFDIAIDLDPTNVDAYYNKGTTLDTLGDLGDPTNYEEAIKCFDKIITDLNPNYAPAYSYKGNTLTKLGDLGDPSKYEMVIKCFDKAIDLDPTNAIAYYNKGEALRQLGYLGDRTKYEEAIKCYNISIDLDPTNVDAYNYKGASLINLGVIGDPRKYEEAIKCFDIAIDLNPTNVDAYNYKGASLINLGVIGDPRKYEEAIKCFDIAIDLNPNYASAYQHKGEALSQLGNLGDRTKYEEAIKCYNIVIDLNPNYASAYHYKGEALSQLGNLGDPTKYEEAIKSFDRAVELDPSSASSYYARSLVKGLLQKSSDSLDDLEKAITLDTSLVDYVKHNKAFELLKDNKRFKSLLTKGNK